MSRWAQPITIVALQRGTSLPTEDKSPEALPEVRGPLNAKKRPVMDRFLCHTLTDYRTIVEDFYKVVEFVEWLKEYYPEKIPLIIESK
jgi:hypothetical protein